MQKLLIKPVLAFVMVGAMLMGSAKAQSPQVSDQPTKTKTKKTSKKQAEKVAKAKFERGSAESTAERNARLRRECHGGVNAGACAGFTR